MDRFLTWKDLSESDIHRFKMESFGRSYTANPYNDPTLAVLRRVYEDYKAKAEKEASAKGELVWNWDAIPVDPNWPSTVRLSELEAARKREEEPAPPVVSHEQGFRMGAFTFASITPK